MNCPLNQPFHDQELSLSQKIALFDKYGAELPKPFLSELAADLQQLRQYYSKKFNRFERSPYLTILQQPHDIKKLLISSNFVFDFVFDTRDLPLPSSVSVDSTLAWNPDKLMAFIKSTYKPVYAEYLSLEESIFFHFHLGYKDTFNTFPVGVIFVTSNRLKAHHLTKSNFQPKLKSDLTKFFDILEGRVYTAISPFSTSKTIYSSSFESDIADFLNEQIKIIDSYIKRLASKKSRR